VGPFPASRGIDRAKAPVQKPIQHLAGVRAYVADIAHDFR
jgi:hypothetical protein